MKTIIANGQSNPINNTQLTNKGDIAHSILVDELADKLGELFKSSVSRGFYIKYIQLLGVSTVERLAGKALLEGSNPGALFNWLVRREAER